MSEQMNAGRSAKSCKLCGQRFTNDAAFCPFDGEPLVAAPGGWDASDNPLIGKVIDERYKVRRSLGEGGMGAVYHVEHKALLRPFAMKVLRPDLAREKELCGRFIQEARSAATISHPNVVQITDYGHLPDGTPYFVMEFLEGQPLSALMKSGGPMPAGIAVRILEQIASGVGAAHRVGIVHRDLKPDNIFIVHTAQGAEHIKILDFGVAKVAGGAKMTRTGMVFGSPHYMSPEQASGQPVDHRADIYALGILMYEMFTGRLPFEADTFMGVLTKHMFVAPEPFAKVLQPAPELGALEDITMRCLEKKPENRYPTTDALLADIEAVMRLGSGDELEVSRSRRNRQSSGRLRLADELEPPMPYEVTAARSMRGAQDRRTRIAALAIGASVLLLLIAVTSLLWTRAQSSALVGSSALGNSAARSIAVAPPPPSIVVEPPVAVPVPEPEAGAAQPVDKPPEPKPPLKVPRTTAAQPASKPPPVLQDEPAPAKPPKAGAGSGEIINPWAP